MGPDAEFVPCKCYSLFFFQATILFHFPAHRMIRITFENDGCCPYFWKWNGDCE